MEHLRLYKRSREARRLSQLLNTPEKRDGNDDTKPLDTIARQYSQVEPEVEEEVEDIKKIHHSRALKH